VITFRFGAEDLGRVRFAVSPLFELASSLDVLRDPAAHSLHQPWARAARESVRTLDFWLLDAALPEYGYCYRPDFITPPPDKPVAALEAELDRVRATPPEQVARELAWAYPRGLPPGARALLEDKGLARLVDTMAAYFDRALAPSWPAIKALLEADIAARASQLAAAGPLAALSDLHPDVAWRDGALEVRRPYEETVELAGRGLLLIPSAFAWPRVWAMFDAPWQPAVVYPARGVGSLWAPAPPAVPDALSALLGHRRAEILAQLPASTQELAQRLNASAGGVSEHLGVLRAAGLVQRRREGRAVRYVRTEIGEELARI
jgi:DNA-binding transcriptional ArsR family regulator